ncbi:roadblock/LC7 domain-containing protein [Massilia sp. PWRC2]|uniref:roadblock/LC7 domain-containing protein n=1 Tax=Massilia sp. PWRC2 TaxID=2804626 RepID=UPI003CF83BE3
MTEIDHLPPGLRETAERAVNACLAELVGMSAVVIATVDGFDLAAAAHGQHDGARIAAMASSISAISAMVAREAGLGNVKSVTISTDNGFAIVHGVPRPDVELVIHLIADGDAILAQAMHRIGVMARVLAGVGS